MHGTRCRSRQINLDIHQLRTRVPSHPYGIAQLPGLIKIPFHFPDFPASSVSTAILVRGKRVPFIPFILVSQSPNHLPRFPRIFCPACERWNRAALKNQHGDFVKWKKKLLKHIFFLRFEIWDVVVQIMLNLWSETWACCFNKWFWCAIVTGHSGKSGKI